MIRLKLWRLQEGLTQGEAARRLGIGESTFALLETGRLSPSTSQMDLLRRSFKSETDSLFDVVRERVSAQ
jgi:transcriptional regulator with XRE-family HTH domain